MSDDLGEMFVEEMEEIKEKQRKCNHQLIDKVKRKDEWECRDCGLHFKPKNYKESRFLEWAKDQPYIDFQEEVSGDSEQKNAEGDALQ